MLLSVSNNKQILHGSEFLTFKHYFLSPRVTIISHAFDHEDQKKQREVVTFGKID